MAASGRASLRPEPLLAGPSWAGPQFIAADAKGRVHLLRAETLEVYPVTAKGLGEPRRLKTISPEKNEARVDAAMDLSGDWVIKDGQAVRWFRGGEEKPVAPPGWPVLAVGALRGEPIAGVGPFPIGRRPLGDKVPEVPPHLLTWSGKEWRALVSEPASDDARKGQSHAWIEERSVALAAGSDGKLWAGDTFRYRLRRLSPAGRTLLEIAVGDGEVQRVGAAAGLEAKEKELKAEVERQGVANREKAGYEIFTAVPVIRAIVEGRDGKIYVLVREGGSGLGLDRFDPVLAKLERVRLALSTEGRLSLAAGKDSLYLAAYDGRKGRWHVSWEALDAAPWAEVEGAEITGEAMPPE